MDYHVTVLKHWDDFINSLEHKTPRNIAVDGQSLALVDIVAFSRYHAVPELSQSCIPKVEGSAQYLARRIQAGDVIYAVNTGVGGSADTQTKQLASLQKALLLHLNCGILYSEPKENSYGSESQVNGANIRIKTKSAGPTSASPTTQSYAHITVLRQTLKCAEHGDLRETAMPEAWVKAAMLVRSNTLAAGNSGISVDLLKRFMDLMNCNIVPLVPLRGSISASGDLTPLSYIAGALAGTPVVSVWAGPRESRFLKRADVALKDAGLEPRVFGHKEAISIVNGTAVSAAVAALAMHDAHCFAVLTDTITAMAVEAMHGVDESFSKFFGASRPHPGQIASSANIRHNLAGSKLLRDDVREIGRLSQDRYSLRTASQWIGPALEELMQAHTQIVTELNSTTDNPLVDSEGEKILHGGNFQAMAVTSAMEKVRNSLQIFGRMIFSQITELINPAFNHGLPPNLTAEDPSLDFLMKGVDVHMAAYTSELGFLAGRITPHVMSAEMNNQSINSLALISARYTFEALKVFTSLTSTALVALCQALDLRVIHVEFVKAFRPQFEREVSLLFTQIPSPSSSKTHQQPAHRPIAANELWNVFESTLLKSQNQDIATRFQTAALRCQSYIFAYQNLSSSPPSKTENPSLPNLSPTTINILTNLHTFASTISTQAHTTWLQTRDIHTPEKTLPYLGNGSKRMYNFTRLDLRVPFLRVLASPDMTDPFFQGSEKGASVGSFISRVFGAAKDGSLFVPVMEGLREGLKEGGRERNEGMGKGDEGMGRKRDFKL